MCMVSYTTHIKEIVASDKRCGTPPLVKLMSKHGKLAKGKTRMTLVIDVETKMAVRHLAKLDNRTMSNWVLREIESAVAARKLVQAIDSAAASAAKRNG